MRFKIESLSEPDEDLLSYLGWLLTSDWESPDSALQLANDLTLKDVASSRLFDQTRLFLRLIVETGGFYRRLFITCFRDFNLTCFYGFEEVPLIHSSIPAILWRSQIVASEWVPLSQMPEGLLLPSVWLELKAREKFPIPRHPHHNSKPAQDATLWPLHPLPPASDIPG